MLFIDRVFACSKLLRDVVTLTHEGLPDTTTRLPACPAGSCSANAALTDSTREAVLVALQAPVEVTM